MTKTCPGGCITRAFFYSSGRAAAIIDAALIASLEKAPPSGDAIDTGAPAIVDPAKPVENDVIAGRYSMDQQQSRGILVSKLVGNEYRIEETTSPWPWTGTAVLDGARLSGRAHFPKSKATMKVEGK